MTTQAAAAKEQESSDYELSSVPLDERKGWLPIAGIWIAVGIDLSGTIMGVQLGAGLDFNLALTATFLGSLLLGLLAMAATYVGAATGYTSATLARVVFGRAGGRAIALAMAISALGWFGVQTGFFADNAHTATLELVGADLPVWIFTIIGGALMTLTALWGYRSIQKLSSWAVPLLVLLLALALFLAFRNFGSGQLFDSVPATFTYGGAVSLVMGIFVFGVIISPDIARWARTPKQAMAAGFVGFFIGNSLIVLVSLVLSRVLGSDDIMHMFFMLGLGGAALIVLTLAQWTTNTSNLYSAALNLSVIFTRVNRRLLTLIGGVVAIAVALLGIYDAFVPFISAMSAIIAPYGGTYLAEFFMNSSSRLRNPESSIPAIDIYAFVSWAIGGLAGLATTSPGDGLGFGWLTMTTIPALDAILVAFIVHTALRLVSNRSTRRPRPASSTGEATDPQKVTS